MDEDGKSAADALDADRVAGVLTQLVEHTSRILTTAKSYAKESFDNFVAEKVGSMGPMIGHYAHAFTSLNVKTRLDMDNVVQKLYRNTNIQEAFEELVDVEDEWTQFLDGVDKEHSARIGTTTSLNIGDTAPVNATLVDARSGEDTTLKQRDLLENQETLTEAGIQTIVVSFGEREGALRWLEIMKPMPVPMLLDAKRELYRSIGLTVSYAKTWGTASLAYYGEQKAAGRYLPLALEGITDDPNQMGGDLMLDGEGRLVFLYPSKRPSDRPALAQILEVVKTL